MMMLAATQVLRCMIYGMEIPKEIHIDGLLLHRIGSCYICKLDIDVSSSCRSRWSCQEVKQGASNETRLFNIFPKIWPLVEPTV
jgi:hypothetical protein